eukprot:scaffold207_cov409-Prasinococcus_capsulatus_cf.AAC.48
MFWLQNYNRSRLRLPAQERLFACSKCANVPRSTPESTPTRYSSPGGCASLGPEAWKLNLVAKGHTCNMPRLAVGLVQNHRSLGTGAAHLFTTALVVTVVSPPDGVL